jgi:pimeloyl-ACP methyl ester carboxylesterase
LPNLTAADGRTLAWRQTGSGPPLLLHPGGPGCSSRYFGDLPELAAERTILLLDPRGTGDSDRPADPAGYDLEDYAADIEAVRDHLGLDRIDLLGHSHGGFVAMNWAGDHPEHLGRLVLASTAPRFTDEIRRRRAQRLESHRGQPYFEDAMEALEAHQQGRYSSDEELTELFRRDWRLQLAPEVDYEPIVESLSKAGNNADALRHFNERVAAGMDHRAHLQRIDAPTLVLAAELDPFAASARETADHLPDPTLVILPGADHFTFLEEKNRPAWSRAVLDFLGTR